MRSQNLFPKEVMAAWENRKAEVIFTTVSKEGIPNSIYVTCVSYDGGNKIVIANNYFDKTMKNILSGSQGVVLFITKDEKPKSFQVKGSIEYVTKGEVYDDMKSWNPKHLPGHGAVILKIEEIFSGANKLL